MNFITIRPVPMPTMEVYRAAIAAHLDAVVQARGYDSIYTAASYRDDPINPDYAAEGAAAFHFRTEVWTYANAEMKKVELGQRAQPTVDEFLCELPAIAWPPIKR